MFYRPTFGDDLGDKIILYQRALHDLGVALGLARRSGNTAAVAMLQEQWNQRKREIDAMIRVQARAESPSPFALGLANIGGDLSGLALKLALGVGAVLAAAIILPPLLARRRR